MSSKTSRAWSACSSFPTAGAKFRSSSKPVKFRSASAVREKFSAPAEPALQAIPAQGSRSKADVSEPINPLITAKIRAVFGADQSEHWHSCRSPATLRAAATIEPISAAPARRHPSSSWSCRPAARCRFRARSWRYLRRGPEELPFLNVHRFLSRTGVNVPQILGAWEKDGILLLEDLGEQRSGTGSRAWPRTTSSPGIKKPSTSC